MEDRREIEDWPYGDIEHIRREVGPEYHNVVDLMQRARLEMKAFERKRNPNTESITDLRETKIIVFLQALKVRDPKTSQLIVNDELVIDAKAFLQMTQEDRDTLIKEAETFKTKKESDTIALSKDASVVCKKYRLMFDKQRMAGIQRLLTAFKVNSREELSFGGIKFVELEPNDEDRVIKVFKDPPINYNEKYSKVIRTMADRFQFDNVQDFVAFAEYTIRTICKEIDLRRKNPHSLKGKPDGVKVKEYFFGIVAEEVINNENSYQEKIEEEFKKQVEKCNRDYHKHELRFKTLMAAANHYDKHSHEFRSRVVDNNEPVTPDKYFEIAREICSKPKENPTWTQDGSSVSWQIHHHDGTFAVRYDNPYKGTAVIATLHVKKKEPN